MRTIFSGFSRDVNVRCTIMSRDWDADDRMRDLAFSAIPSAWIAMTTSDRDDIIDLLSTYDHVLALRYLVDSASIDPAIADAIRTVLGQPDNLG